ncbi:MAG: A/G-specific adenine glycosylase [Oscillospiraceae bacterium]|nr:A/G-specific adenine glycosylase [Oscillospiraceae bacterium]
MTSPEELSPIVPLLLRWFDGSQRILPWRDSPTPYRVWVSEIMLQQTRVSAAIPYFHRFLQALPTVEALACAPDDRLNKLWEGLGYYSRVRNMKKAAQVIVEQYGGVFPSTPEELRRLPGIGEYTAGSVASIAFGRQVPCVDGNVLRVFARLLDSPLDIASPAVKKQFTALAAALVPAGRPGDFNQSLMELGAIVCLPNGEPLCGQCPLQGLCRGYQAGTAASLPVKAPKKPRMIEERTVLLCRSPQGVLLTRRPASGILAGLWEYPCLSGQASPEEATLWLREQGLFPLSLKSAGRAKHIFTHREWHMTGYLAEVAGGPAPQGFIWATPEQLLERYAIPGAYKYYSALLKQPPLE